MLFPSLTPAQLLLHTVGRDCYFYVCYQEAPIGLLFALQRGRQPEISMHVLVWLHFAQNKLKGFHCEAFQVVRMLGLILFMYTYVCTTYKESKAINKVLLLFVTSLKAIKCVHQVLRNIIIQSFNLIRLYPCCSKLGSYTSTCPTDRLRKQPSAFFNHIVSSCLSLFLHLKEKKCTRLMLLLNIFPSQIFQISFNDFCQIHS